MRAIIRKASSLTQ